MSLFGNKRKDYSIQPPKQLVPAGGFSVTDSGNINFTYFNSNLTADLTTTSVIPGTYGNITNIPRLTIDQWGRVTGVTLVPFSVAGLALETNGTPNGDQTLLNLVAGTNMTITDDGLGNITFDATSSGGGILHGTASGTDTYTTTITGVTSYADGDAYLIRFPNGNTTGATININGLGAISLYRNNDGPVIGGDIQANSEMLLVYNSTTNIFQCIGTSPNTIIAYVTNAESITITKGQAVYAFGGTGDRMTVKLANNTSDATSAQTVGLVFSTSIAANQKGFIMLQGLLDGLNTLPTSTWNDGDPVYLGPTAGSITKNKPYAPNHLVYLGVVTTASPGNAGRMYVKVQNGYELDELHNVQAQSPTVNDVLYYFGGTPGQWKTASIASVLGFTPLSQTLANTQIFVGNGSNIATAVAMSGDTIISNTGAVTIANNAVTYAKMQAVSTTSRLLGSSSTTTPVQEITLGTGLSMSGTTLSATGSGITALTGDVTASGSGSVAATLKTNLRIGSCGVTFDGGSGTITNGKTAYVQVPYAGTITDWTIVSSVSGSCTVTVFKDTYANFPPTTPADNIFATQPALASAIKATATGLSVAVTAGDWIGFTISGVTTVTWVNLTLSITKT
jgi:hypothetical protein